MTVAGGSAATPPHGAPSSAAATDAAPPSHDPGSDLPSPRYGQASLADLIPSVLAGLGVPGERPVLGLPAAPRVCVLLVDGLGLDLLRAHPADAPFLTSLLERPSRDEQALTAAFPATTSASLGSLGTGLPSGAHGLVGFEMYVPELGRVLNCLRWAKDVDPRSVQPMPTAFERAVSAGVEVTRVGPKSFDGSGLTEAALRGGRYRGADRLGERVAATGEALRHGSRALVYVYYGDIDATGHVAGCGSAAWRYQLAHADHFAEQLAAVLPADGLLLVTADHGMVDVPADARVDVADNPHLDEGVRLLAGEPRALYVHTTAGAEDDVLATWRETLGAGAWVLAREEAIAAGWFGSTVAPHVRSRIGDVVVAAREAVAVVDSRRMRRELLELVGMHGSLTPAELFVPLLQVTHS